MSDTYENLKAQKDALVAQLARSHKQEGHWIALMGKAKAECGEQRQRAERAEAQLAERDVQFAELRGKYESGIRQRIRFARKLDAARWWSRLWKARAKTWKGVYRLLQKDKRAWVTLASDEGARADRAEAQVAATRALLLEAFGCLDPKFTDVVGRVAEALADKPEIRAGDSAKHGPTGETWFVLGVDRAKGKVCVAGWPPTIAELADCTLVERGKGITDEERASRTLAFGGGWEG